MSAVSTSMGDS